MRKQQKFRAPAGYKELNELSRNERAASSKFHFDWKSANNLATYARPHFNLGSRKSRKPVTLAKKA